MINENEKAMERQIIIVDDEPKVIPGQGESETPMITIEASPAPSRRGENNDSEYVSKAHRWLWFVGGLLLSAIICIAAVAGWRYYRTYINIGIPVSVTSEENIAKLKVSTRGFCPPEDGGTERGVKTIDNLEGAPEVIMTSDSILGVALNFYEIRGLKAEVTLQEPDTTDTSVYLYSRCADHDKNNEYLGSMVMNGKELQSDNTRLGYCAMANDNIVIGVARNEDVKDYVMEHGGSFFRQFILVSNGVLPSKFYLHGKVERRGLGRIGEKLYYIETRHAETMWDFADALREYGFVDVIYITGGDDYSFYRTADGTRHDIGRVEKYPHKKGKGVIPWIVFRKK